MDEIALWAGKITDNGRRIAKLLCTDARAFVTDQIRRRFIETPEVADALDDAAVATLKAESSALAERAVAALGAALADDSIWLEATSDDAGASIHAIPAVAAGTAALADAVDAFLDDNGLHPGEPIAYRLPARFIDGENLATLTRNLWKASARHGALRAEQAAKSKALTTEERARRWDDA